MAAFFNTSTTKTIIGLDISPRAIYMVEAKGKPNTPQLLRANHCIIEDNIFSEGYIQDTEALSALLQPLLASCYSNHIALCLNDQQLTRKIIQLEKNLSEEDLEDNVSFELERSLSFPLEDAYFDFAIVNTNSEDENLDDIIVTACRRKLIDKQTEVLEALGFNICLVSSMTSVLGHFLIETIKAEQQTEICGLVNIDADATHLVICHGEQEIFSDTVKNDNDSTEQGIESLITLAQTEHKDLQLHTLYLTGINVTESGIDSLKQYTQANVITYNPFHLWQHDIKLAKANNYCVAAALALEGLR